MVKFGFRKITAGGRVEWEWPVRWRGRSWPPYFRPTNREAITVSTKGLRVGSVNSVQWNAVT